MFDSVFRILAFYSVFFFHQSRFTWFAVLFWDFDLACFEGFWEFLMYFKVFSISRFLATTLGLADELL